MGSKDIIQDISIINTHVLHLHLDHIESADKDQDIKKMLQIDINFKVSKDLITNIERVPREEGKKEFIRKKKILGKVNQEKRKEGEKKAIEEKDEKARIIIKEDIIKPIDTDQ